MLAFLFELKEIFRYNVDVVLNNFVSSIRRDV